jgi:hypothetical protein
MAGDEFALLDDGPSDEDRMEFTESIADYLATNPRYGEMSKREAAVEAVRLVMDDARLETRRLLAPPGPMYLYKVGFTRDTVKDPQARSFPCIILMHDGGTIEVEVSEDGLLSLLSTTTQTLKDLATRRRYADAKAAHSGRSEQVR